MVRYERPMQSGPRYATDRDTTLVSPRDDPLDQLTASLAAPRAGIETVFNNDSIVAIALEKLRELPEAPLLGVERRLGSSETPVDKKLRSVEDRESETFRDGIDGDDAFHSSWAGSDP